MPSWRVTCAAMPAFPSEVSAAHCPSPCRLLPDHCLHRGCMAAYRQPAGFPGGLSLQTAFTLGLAAPRVTHLGLLA